MFNPIIFYILAIQTNVHVTRQIPVLNIHGIFLEYE